MVHVCLEFGLGVAMQLKRLYSLNYKLPYAVRKWKA